MENSARPGVLGENIKKYRLLKELTQEKLAQRANVTHSSMSKIEAGFNDNPRIKTVQRIAVALGVTIDDLMQEQSMI